MLAEMVDRRNDNNNNNNSTTNHNNSYNITTTTTTTTTTNNNTFPVFPKDEDRLCETDDENIDVEVDSDGVDDCTSEHGDPESPGTPGGLCESRTALGGTDSEASLTSSPRLKDASPTLPDHEESLLPGRTKISTLSFGIDRILNAGSDKVSPHALRPPPGLDTRPEVHLAKPLLSPGSQKHLSPLTAPHQRTLPLDLVSSLNPFHSSLISPDVCRMDSSSLEILPVRPAWPDVYVCPWTGVQRDRFGLVRRVGHPYQNRTPPKRKKPRTAFTRQQVLELEKRFTRQKYLASAERSALAKTLNMTDAQVKTWFQNRRTKWRRQTAEEREIERQAAHKFLMSLRQDDSSRNMPYGGLCGVAQTTSLPGTDTAAPSVVASVN